MTEDTKTSDELKTQAKAVLAAAGAPLHNLPGYGGNSQIYLADALGVVSLRSTTDIMVRYRMMDDGWQTLSRVDHVFYVAPDGIHLFDARKLEDFLNEDSPNAQRGDLFVTPIGRVVAHVGSRHWPFFTPQRAEAAA